MIFIDLYDNFFVRYQFNKVIFTLIEVTME